MSRYIYSVIRFVPNPASGEFVNIGAIVGNDELREWEVRSVSNHRRAKGLDQHGVMAKVFDRVSELEALCEAVEFVGDTQHAMSEEILAGLYAEWQNIVQLSEPAPIVAQTATDALEVVFGNLVIDPGKQRREYRTSSQAFSAVLSAYRRVGIDWAREYVHQRSWVKPAHHPIEFDFAVANGRAVQLTQTWSFEIPNIAEVVEQVRAWAWAVGEIRRTGARVANDGTQVDVPQDVDIQVVYLPPSSDAGTAAFNEAKAAFAEVRATARPETEASSVAERAKELLLAAE